MSLKFTYSAGFGLPGSTSEACWQGGKEMNEDRFVLDIDSLWQVLGLWAPMLPSAVHRSVNQISLHIFSIGLAKKPSSESSGKDFAWIS